MVRFVLNPGGGRGRAAQFAEPLRALAATAGSELMLSRDAAHLTALARQAAADGVERLVVAGGDGTQHYVVQGLAGTTCALAAIPLGSGNDLAATLGMPAELGAAVQAALAAPIRSLDLARVDDQLYAGVAGVGFDSAANETANRVRRLKGPLIYVYAVLHTLVTFRPPLYSIAFEGGSFEGRAMLMVMANTPRFGGGMRVAPQADTGDGLLDLVIVRQVPRRTFLRVFPKVYKGTHAGHPAIFTARSSWAKVGLDRPMHVYGDGERMVPVGEGGVRFECLPAALRAVSPL